MLISGGSAVICHRTGRKVSGVACDMSYLFDHDWMATAREYLDAIQTDVVPIAPRCFEVEDELFALR